MTRDPTVHIIARIRGAANGLLLLGSLVLLVAFAMHWPPAVIAPIGLLTITMLIVSFFAIVIENRITPDEEAEEQR